ncbi:hypothetical protein COD14_31380 [Bacillus cereus]|nr:hypothetical protein COD14_31780 [Bacillus cereus]PGT50187.1 hypothetical protein COD14_31380 [Bacillus cereus]
MFQEGLTYVTELNLTGATLRIYIILLSKLDYINWLTIRQKDIAEKLLLKREEVSRAIKELCIHGILVKNSRIGISTTYRLNPSFTFRGLNKNKFLNN